MQTVPISNLTSAVQNRMVALADVAAHKRNYNRHSPAQITRIAASLTKFGQVRSVVTHRGRLLAGHGVVEAAKSLGWVELRADVLPDSYDENLARAYIVADNELARQSDPDQVQLAQLLEEARQFDVTLLDAMGYSDADLDVLLAEIEEGAQSRLHEPPDNDRNLGQRESAVKVVVALADLAIFERAIRATGLRNRGEAMLAICQRYLDAKGQFDSTPEGDFAAQLARLAA